MAGNFTDYCEELILNIIFRNTGVSPGNVYLGLGVSEISEDTTLDEVEEENDVNYERKELLFAEPSQIDNKAVIKNSNKLVYGPWSIDAQAPITSAFICDTQTGVDGNILSYFELPNVREPKAGESLTILVDDCTLTIR